MANWFEDNPTKSIISYTILVAGSVWAISTFVLNDSRLNLKQAELESKQAQIEQYESKVALLERDIALVRSQNAEYLEWLGRTPGALPAIMPRIAALKAQVSRLQADGKRDNVAPDGSIDVSVKKGTAFEDPVSGVVVAVLNTTPQLTADVQLTPPEGKSLKPNLAAGGKAILSGRHGKVRITIMAVAFITDNVTFRLTPIAE